MDFTGLHSARSHSNRRYLVRATILGAAVGEDRVDADPVFVEERDRSVVEDVSRGHQ